MLARDESVSCYVLEDLTGLINPNTPDRLERGAKKTRRSKKTNTWLHQWAPYLFEQYLTYKCDARGIEVVKVSPEYTSQRCSQCGTIASSSRMKNHYHCSVCGHRNMPTSMRRKTSEAGIFFPCRKDRALINRPEVSRYKIPP